MMKTLPSHATASRRTITQEPEHHAGHRLDRDERELTARRAVVVELDEPAAFAVVGPGDLAVGGHLPILARCRETLDWWPRAEARGRCRSWGYVSSVALSSVAGFGGS